MFEPDLIDQNVQVRLKSSTVVLQNFLILVFFKGRKKQLKKKNNGSNWCQKWKKVQKQEICKYAGFGSGSFTRIRPKRPISDRIQFRNTKLNTAKFYIICNKSPNSKISLFNVAF